MRMVPKGTNHLGAGLKKILDFLVECIRFFTLHIDRPHNGGLRSIEDRHDDLGARCAKRGQISGICGDVSNIDDLPLRNGCAGESFGKRERGMFGLPGATPRHVAHQAGRVVYVIQADPAVVGGTPYEGDNLVKRCLAIASCHHNVLEMREKVVAGSVHLLKIAKR